jgi:hypothetical protein
MAARATVIFKELSPRSRLTGSFEFGAVLLRPARRVDGFATFGATAPGPTVAASPICSPSQTSTHTPPRLFSTTTSPPGGSARLTKPASLAPSCRVMPDAAGVRVTDTPSSAASISDAQDTRSLSPDRVTKV